MTRLLNKSIKAKLIFILSLTALVALFISSLSTFVFTYDMQKRSSIKSLSILTDIIGENLIASIEFDDVNSAATLLASLKKNTTIEAAYILKGDQEIFASYYKTKEMQKKMDKLLESTLLEYKITNDFELSHIDTLLVNKKIVFHDTFIASLVIIENTDNTKELIRDMLMMMVLVFLIALVVIILLAMRLQQVFTDPIFQLRQAMGQVSNNKDYNIRIEDKREDEFKAMFESFNHMISTIKQQNQELIAANEKTNKLAKAKSEFLANMSHEIRTPLNGIMGLTKLVLDTPLSQMQKEYLEKSKKSSHALMHIINDILDYSKIEAGKLDIVYNNFNLENLFENIDDLFGYKTYEKKLELHFSIDHTIPMYLVGDALRLSQVLNNLVGNALKFTQEGYIKVCAEKISMDKERHSVNIRISVEDTGIGISYQNQSKLFNSFEQLDSSNTKKYGGTGLGLMISKQLVELMGGVISVKSQEGEGSKFYFELTFEYTQQDDLQSKLKGLKNTRFLIVDDSELDREYLQNILKSWGIETLVANDAFAAIEILDTQIIDYLLVDWDMPRMDGLELLEHLHKKGKTLQHILMISAYDKQEILLEATQKNLKIDKFLHKPYTPSSLFDAIVEEAYKNSQKLFHTSENQKLHLKEKKHALIVEDNEINQLVAVNTIEQIGFEVSIANDGLEALEAAKNNSYDIIFMDLQMPNMDGFEASKEIRKFDTTTPIVALSAAVMQEDKQLTKEAQMNAHIAKPIDQDELYRVLHTYFELIDVTQTKTQNSLVTVEGIDIAALSQTLKIDTQKLYTMYKKFHDSYKHAIEEIAQMQKGSEDFYAYIHKIKGVSGNLKMQKLHSLATQINNEKKLEVTEEFLQELSSICKTIEQKIIPLIKDQADKEKTSEDLELKEMTYRLLEAVKNFDYIDPKNSDLYLQKIKPKVSQELFEKLQKGFEDLDDTSLFETLSSTSKILHKS